ncbi:MAG: MoaF N-terminal domain-containing protein [Christensenellaceae bacterium]|nr:MoaF N-terminal domain-containing protein [Christensenellaceae bacterium]
MEIKCDRHEGMSIFRPPLCYELTGRKYTLVLDNGYDNVIEFITDEELILTEKGTEKRYPYDCIKMADGCYFVNFEERPLKDPRRGTTIVLDTRESLVTVCYAELGRDPKFPRMPSTEIVFGGVVRPDGTVPRIRHGYTADMVGTSIDWNYGTFNIAHVYQSERFYRVAFTPRALERIMRNSPDMMAGSDGRPPERKIYEDYAEYIKIRDGLYAVSLLETNLARRNDHGNSLFFLMDLKELHDCGRAFGTNGEGLDENYTFGAFGAWYDASREMSLESMYYIH